MPDGREVEGDRVAGPGESDTSSWGRPVCSSSLMAMPTPPCLREGVSWSQSTLTRLCVKPPELAMKMRSTFSKSRPVMTRLRPLAMRPRVASLTGFLALSDSMMSR